MEIELVENSASALVKSLRGVATLEGARITCPHCGTVAVLTEEACLLFDRCNKKPKISGSEVTSVAGARCAACSGLIVVAHVKRKEGAETQPLWPADVRPDRSPRDLPEVIARAYHEARHVLAHSPQAAAVLARRCVQHVIREKLGLKESALFAEIQKALTSDTLSRNTRESLDHVRRIGNLGAHPEFDPGRTLVEVTASEASYTLDVLELLFDDLYFKPAKSAEMKASLSAKRP